jgi:membrane associated rhomboid family serine protease
MCRRSPVSSGALIPLRDTIPTRTVPLVNGAILAACVGVYALQLLAGSGGAALVEAFGFVPARLFHSGELGPGSLRLGVLGLFGSMFLHGGLLHLAGNMLFLWIFGDNVEDALGHGRYLLFYVASGVLSALLQGAFATTSLVPMVGASGAIAGVLGAYFVLFPHARIVTLVPLFFLFPLVEVPAFLFLLLWFLLQFWQGSAELAASGNAGAATGGVAWWAHVGGFAAGIALLALLKPRRRPAPRYWIR